METLPVLNSGQKDLSFGSDGYDDCLEFKIPDYELNSRQNIIGQYCNLGVPNLHNRRDQQETVITELNQYFSSLNITTLNDYRIMKYKWAREQFFQIVTTNKFQKTFDTKLPIGICIPKTCKPQDIESALNRGLDINCILNNFCFNN